MCDVSGSFRTTIVGDWSVEDEALLLAFFFRILGPQTKLVYSKVNMWMCTEAASYRQAARAHAIGNTVEETLSKRHSSSSTSFALVFAFRAEQQGGRKMQQDLRRGVKANFFSIIKFKMLHPVNDYCVSCHRLRLQQHETNTRGARAAFVVLPFPFSPFTSSLSS